MAESKSEASDRLARFLKRVSQFRQAALDDPATTRSHLALKAWQAERLRLTYSDLLAHPRYRQAALFFLTDLYGARDYSQRDADVARILPRLKALLPAAALSAIADAVELDALSEQLDHEMSAALAASNVDTVTVEAYARAYRACANQAAREHQIALSHAIGSALDKLTRIAFLETSIKMMRKPAKMAGLAQLQNFLERGFVTFKQMAGAAEFLDTIRVRETEVMNRLFDAVGDPFADKVPPATGTTEC